MLGQDKNTVVSFLSDWLNPPVPVELLRPAPGLTLRRFNRLALGASLYEAIELFGLEMTVESEGIFLSTRVKTVSCSEGSASIRLKFVNDKLTEKFQSGLHASPQDQMEVQREESRKRKLAEFHARRAVAWVVVGGIAFCCLALISIGLKDSRPKPVGMPPQANAVGNRAPASSPSQTRRNEPLNYAEWFDSQKVFTGPDGWQDRDANLRRYREYEQEFQREQRRREYQREGR